MSKSFGRRIFQVVMSASLLAVTVLSVASRATAQAAQTAPALVMATLDKGWAKFSWVPGTRGPLTFGVTVISINPDSLTLPALLTFTATAR